MFELVPPLGISDDQYFITFSFAKSAICLEKINYCVCQGFRVIFHELFTFRATESRKHFVYGYLNQAYNHLL